MATTTNFYRQGQGYFTDDGRRIANTSELQGLASKGGVEVDPRTKQPVKQVATQKAASIAQRPGAYGASDWRSFQALKDSATGLIDILNNKNADLTASQNYFGQAYKDTSAFGGPRDVTTQPNAMITSNKNFRELSPADQASIIASRQGASLAGLQTVADERASREKIYGTGLDNLRKMQEDQLAAKKEETLAAERAADNARQDRAQKLQYGAAYYDQDGNLQMGTPPNVGDFDWNDFTAKIGTSAFSQGYDLPVDYIAGRKIHGGYDIKTPMYTPIPAPVAGRVVEVTQDNGKKTGWGNSVVIEDSVGNRWRVAHLDSVNVKVGDTVGGEFKSGVSSRFGGAIGLSGSTGKSTGPHTHVEVQSKSGKLIDPRNISTSLGSGKDKLTPSVRTTIARTIGLDLNELKTTTDVELQAMEAAFKENKDTDKKVNLSIIKEADKNSLVSAFGGKINREAGLALLIKYANSDRMIGGNSLQIAIGELVKNKSMTKDDGDILMLKLNAAIKKASE